MGYSRRNKSGMSRFISDHIPAAAAGGCVNPTYLPYVGAFFGAILLLAGGMIVGRSLFGVRREHGNVLDINATARAQAQAAAAPQRKAA
jgi:hypothetical protein